MTAPILTADLLDWYADTFVPDSASGYGQMNPVGAEGKYSTKKGPLKRSTLAGALTGETRRLPIDGIYRQIPVTISVTPQTHDGLARSAILEIDHGGAEAVQRTLAVCADLGLWAFAQLSEST